MAADTQTPPVDQIVDWELAARTAIRVGRPGPAVGAVEAEQIVAELRQAAAAAHPHVAEVTHLATPAGEGVLVVDRASWSRANIAAFRNLLDPVVTELFEKRDKPPTPARVTAIGSRVTGAEVGTLLGILSSRVLGQYDAFGDPGRLLLVAPTIVAIERELEVDAVDFRLWVCLHEETHRVQFTSTEWLAEHLLGEIRALIGDLVLDPGQFADRLVGALRKLPGVVRGEGSTTPLLDALQTPDQRSRLAGITAVMSLLEGHADVVMDDVGPQVVPSVSTIRDRFSRRRAGRGAVDQVLRRLLGLDAKARQYADGARFVRGVIEHVGMDGFNQVWTSPQTLPQPAEIADPLAWVRRVHG